VRNLTLIGLFVGWGIAVASGQQAASTATAVTAAAKVYDEGPDVIAPKLLPRTMTIPEADACESESDDEIDLSLTVDATGKPRDVTLINPAGTPLERLALRIVEGDSFKPGTLKGEAVAVKSLAQVSIEGCYATKKDAAGNSTRVFRLKAQPVQTFGAKPKGEEGVAAEVPQRESREIAAAKTFEAAAAETPGLERIGKNGVSAPVPLNSVTAEFSDEARRKNIQGICLVQLIVDAQGRPQNPRIIRTLGYGLDQKALEAVKKYHFKPAMKAGVPVLVMITVAVNFSL
jgi:TonB family protein